MTLSASNYFDATKNIDWNAVPASLKKTHDTLIPDASQNDWQAFKSDDDVRRVVEKYFGYIGKYVSPTVATNTESTDENSAPKIKKATANASNRTGEKEAREVAMSLIRPYVVRGDSLESIRKSWLGSSGNGSSAQVRGNKIFVDRVSGNEVNFSFSLSAIFNEIKGPSDTGKSKSTKSKKGKVKDVSTLPMPKQVVHIPTSTAFIKRYAALHGKVKTRDQILSLVHGLQKAITEQRIISGNPAMREVEKMQTELISLASTMGDSAKIEIDASSLAHYKQIGQGEAVRTSVKLLKSFISMSGKAIDKGKADALGQKMEKALDIIPKEDPYLKQLSDAKKALAAYSEGKHRTISIPSASLHGLGGLAAGTALSGLGFVPGSSEGAIISLLRVEGVKNLSDASLKKAFRRTAVPGLCLEIAHSLIRRGELTNAVLNATPTKKKLHQGAALSGIENNPVQQRAGISDIDILEMRLQNRSRSLSGLGSAYETVNRSSNRAGKQEAIPSESRMSPNGQIMSAEALKTMKFETIGLTGKWKNLIGDPAPGFSAMVYGLPKQGKSTFCLQLANDLAKHGQVLYCALEEGFGATLSEKLHRLGIAANTLQFGNHIPRDLRRYKFVFIDSVSEAGLDAEGLRELRKENPRTAFIFVYHSTKAGNFRGSNTDAHDVDIIVEVKDGAASARGRYGPPAEMQI